eukprot:TRINITY_DN19291_c0_g1_i1.p1 TRINITY_DN19291_c0_g1~~TRINITY_DN19291_c0_g1_i1.p1  ORF type:complete len:494 (+),score=62.04 TRINITY_DN19291_c0_g1_i1:59-1483(+)
MGYRRDDDIASKKRQRLCQYAVSPDFPPKSLCQEFKADPSKAAAWYREVFEASDAFDELAYVPTDRERFLYTRSAEQYVALRRSEGVSCEEFAAALVKRARQLRRMNQWIFTSYCLFDKLVEQARALDEKAAKEGVESIAPLYGLPIPMKGTAAVVDYPSGAGCGILSGYVPVKDSDLTSLIKAKHGLIFGTTNVPEFAASYTTANPASGHTRNPYGRALTVGGSSGGATSVVAAYAAPLAVTEDTGGSTRLPAACCQNFGFDPSRNHYPNAGNPGMSYTNDQLGLVARNLSDIIFYDTALMGTGKFHKAAAESAASRTPASIKIGAPLHPFVDTLVAKDLFDPLGYDGLCISPELRQKFDLVKAKLSAAGMSVLNREWPSKHFDYLGRDENVMVEALFGSRKVNGSPLDLWLMLPVYAAFTGQLATFTYKFLNAPVSTKEIVEDMGCTGTLYNPGFLHTQADKFDETQLLCFA